MEFRFTHCKREDGRLIGVLPAPSDANKIAFAYDDPRKDGQTYERDVDSFNRIFMKL